MKRREMINEVCEKFKVNPEDITSLRRDQNLVKAKKVIYCVLRMYGLTFNQIGRIVNKDHQTILMTIRTMPNGLKRYATFIYKKYLKQGLEEEINQQQATLRKQRKQIIELLNKNYPIGQIVFETHQSKEFIKEQVQYFLKNGWRKKIPNYKNGTYSVIFYEKDSIKNNDLLKNIENY